MDFICVITSQSDKLKANKYNNKGRNTPNHIFLFALKMSILNFSLLQHNTLIMVRLPPPPPRMQGALRVITIGLHGISEYLNNHHLSVFGHTPGSTLSSLLVGIRGVLTLFFSSQYLNLLSMLCGNGTAKISEYWASKSPQSD